MTRSINIGAWAIALATFLLTTSSEAQTAASVAAPPPLTSVAHSVSSRANHTPSAATWRGELGLLGAGIGTGTDVPRGRSLIVGVGAHLTVVHRSGHGGRVALLTSASGLFNESRNSFIFEAGYVRRLRLAGDNVVGLGIDFGGGVSVGNVEDSGGLCLPSPCPGPTSVADGTHLGLNAGATLLVRAWFFSAGLDMRGRGLMALKPGNGDSPTQVDGLALLYLGFAL